ncbi:MAG: NADH-quinone oxidoreductase subunit J, partial [Planctomycetales bacterium]
RWIDRSLVIRFSLIGDADAYVQDRFTTDEENFVRVAWMTSADQLQRGDRVELPGESGVVYEFIASSWNEDEGTLELVPITNPPNDERRQVEAKQHEQFLVRSSRARGGDLRLGDEIELLNDNTGKQAASLEIIGLRSDGDARFLRVRPAKGGKPRELETSLESTHVLTARRARAKNLNVGDEFREIDPQDQQTHQVVGAHEPPPRPPPLQCFFWGLFLVAAAHLAIQADASQRICWFAWGMAGTAAALAASSPVENLGPIALAGVVGISLVACSATTRIAFVASEGREGLWKTRLSAATAFLIPALLVFAMVLSPGFPSPSVNSVSLVTAEFSVRALLLPALIWGGLGLFLLFPPGTETDRRLGALAAAAGLVLLLNVHLFWLASLIAVAGLAALSFHSRPLARDFGMILLAVVSVALWWCAWNHGDLLAERSERLFWFWTTGGAITLLGAGICLASPERMLRGLGGVAAASALAATGVHACLFDWINAVNQTFLFWLMSGTTLCSALAAITHRNPVYCALWFGLTLLGTAGLFLVLGAQFLATATVVVYAGAILVMFLFVLMLAAPRGNAPSDQLSWEPVISATAAAALVGALSVSLGQLEGPSPASAAERQTDILAAAHVAHLGRTLFTEHLLAVEVAGTLLMVGLVGAVAIVAHGRGGSANPNPVTPDPANPNSEARNTPAPTSEE